MRATPIFKPIGKLTSTTRHWVDLCRYTLLSVGTAASNKSLFHLIESPRIVFQVVQSKCVQITNHIMHLNQCQKTSCKSITSNLKD